MLLRLFGINDRSMNPIQILLVEDNEGDILLIEEAFSDAKVVNTIAKIKDGDNILPSKKKVNSAMQLAPIDAARR